MSDRLLSPAQVTAVADAMPAHFRVLVLAAAWSGLRQGELLALTRADVDLDAVPAVVRVRRSIRRSESGTIRIDLPKTAASIRTVTLPAPLVSAVAEHMTAYVGPDPDAPVFRTATGSLPPGRT